MTKQSPLSPHPSQSKSAQAKMIPFDGPIATSIRRLKLVSTKFQNLMRAAVCLSSIWNLWGDRCHYRLTTYIATLRMKFCPLLSQNYHCLPVVCHCIRRRRTKRVLHPRRLLLLELQRFLKTLTSTLGTVCITLNSKLALFELLQSMKLGGPPNRGFVTSLLLQ